MTITEQMEMAQKELENENTPAEMLKRKATSKEINTIDLTRRPGPWEEDKCIQTPEVIGVEDETTIVK